MISKRIGDLSCKEMDCMNCPFNLPRYFKICTSLKLNDNLFMGLDVSSVVIERERRKAIREILNKKINNDENAN